MKKTPMPMGDKAPPFMKKGAKPMKAPMPAGKKPMPPGMPKFATGGSVMRGTGAATKGKSFKGTC